MALTDELNNPLKKKQPAAGAIGTTSTMGATATALPASKPIGMTSATPKAPGTGADKATNILGQPISMNSKAVPAGAQSLTGTVPAGAHQAQANTSEVGKNATVSGQLNSLLDQNSDYLKRAKATALDQANQRGFLNSTMAIGATHAAAIDAALPIAQQDASTYDMRERTNTDILNRNEEFNASARQQADQAGLDRQHQITLENLATTNKQKLMEVEQAHKLVMEKLQTENKQALIDIEMNWKKEIEQNQTASQAYMQAIQSMGQALGNGELSAKQQQRAVSEITGQLSAFLDFNKRLTGIEGVIPIPSNATQTFNADQLNKMIQDAVKAAVPKPVSTRGDENDSKFNRPGGIFQGNGGNGGGRNR